MIVAGIMLGLWLSAALLLAPVHRYSVDPANSCGCCGEGVPCTCPCTDWDALAGNVTCPCEGLYNYYEVTFTVNYYWGTTACTGTPDCTKTVTVPVIAQVGQDCVWQNQSSSTGWGVVCGTSASACGTDYNVSLIDMELDTSGDPDCEWKISFTYEAIILDGGGNCFQFPVQSVVTKADGADPAGNYGDGTCGSVDFTETVAFQVTDVTVGNGMCAAVCPNDDCSTCTDGLTDSGSAGTVYVDISALDVDSSPCDCSTDPSCLGGESPQTRVELTWDSGTDRYIGYTCIDSVRYEVAVYAPPHRGADCWSLEILRGVFAGGNPCGYPVGTEVFVWKGCKSGDTPNGRYCRDDAWSPMCDDTVDELAVTI